MTLKSSPHRMSLFSFKRIPIVLFFLMHTVIVFSQNKIVIEKVGKENRQITFSEGNLIRVKYFVGDPETANSLAKLDGKIVAISDSSITIKKAFSKKLTVIELKKIAKIKREYLLTQILVGAAIMTPLVIISEFPIPLTLIGIPAYQLTFAYVINPEKNVNKSY